MTSAGLLARRGVQGDGGSSPPILKLEKADGRFWLIVWGAATRGYPASVRGLLSRIGWAVAEEGVEGGAGVDE